MNIGEAAKKASLTIKSVRYYADIGLVVPCRSSRNGYRQYSKNDLARLQLISKSRRYGFSIKECKELLDLYQDKSRASKDVKRLTLDKIVEIEIKLNELKSLRDQLVILADSCDGDERSDCPILEKLSNRIAQ